MHGGWNYDRYNDFFELNMVTLNWVRVETTGFQRGINWHTLSRMSPSHLFLVGGSRDNYPMFSDKVMIFDADKREWREEAPLPPEAVDREGGGLYNHRAVEIPTENGVAVICIGGGTGRGFSSNLIVFDISY